jgi:hypothetical protein
MMNVANPVAYHVEPPGSDSYIRPPAVLSVEVGEDEDVEWIWTHGTDGRSVVTGYRIVPRLPRSLAQQRDRHHG